MATPTLIFQIFKGDQLLMESRLTQQVIKVGKLPSSHLRIDDDSVSRMHAVIEISPAGDIHVIDLGSVKGTFVNGQKINKAKIQPGDQILIGETRVELTVAEAVAEPVAAAPMAPAPAPMAMPGMPPAPMPGMPPAMPMAAAAPMAMPAMPAPSFKAPPGMASPFATATAAPTGFQAYAAESVDDVGGARAVEVAAMLGDSVVGVKHVMNPKSGKVTSATWALFGGGAAAILVSLFAFGSSVSNAKHNKAKLEAHQAKGTERAYRPNNLGGAYDAMGIGGLLVGLGCLTAGLMRYREEKRSPFFRIGQSPDVEFPIDQSPTPSFAMVAPLGDDFVFNFGQGMDGEMIVDGRSTPLAELMAQGRARSSVTAPGAVEVPMPPKSRIRVKSGQTTFLVSAVPQPKRQTSAFLASLDGGVLAYFGGAAVAAMIFMFLVDRTEVDTSMSDVDLGSLEDQDTESDSTAQDDPNPPEQEDKPDDGEEESGGTGTAMILEEGKMGKEDSQRAEGRYKMQKTQEQEQLARQNAVEAARTAGVLGSASLNNGQLFASLTGTGDVSSGFDDMNIQGGLLGNEAGEMQGGWGFGRSGYGAGGGGTGIGTIGTGRYGTIGHGSGTGTGYGVGGGRGGMGGRESKVPKLVIGKPTANGDLDKAIIRRYIKQNINKISFCYEKQLVAKPTLEGTVNTQFFISPTGSVATATASGVDGEVSSCVAGVIKGINFPKPKGGGGVQVNYPFSFRPTGG